MARFPPRRWIGFTTNTRTAPIDPCVYPGTDVLKNLRGLEALFSKLQRENRLAGSPRDVFCNRPAFYKGTRAQRTRFGARPAACSWTFGAAPSRPVHFGELNAIHPFREGNGRKQREFIRQLAIHAGFTLDWSRVTPDEMREASRLSFLRADNSGLERVLLAAAGL